MRVCCVTVDITVAGTGKLAAIKSASKQTVVYVYSTLICVSTYRVQVITLTSLTWPITYIQKQARLPRNNAKRPTCLVTLNGFPDGMISLAKTNPSLHNE